MTTFITVRVLSLLPLQKHVQAPTAFAMSAVLPALANALSESLKRRTPQYNPKLLYLRHGPMDICYARMAPNAFLYVIDFGDESRVPCTLLHAKVPFLYLDLIHNQRL